MTDSSPKYERGKHPHSLDNLNQPGPGRKTTYDEKKQNQTVRITPTAWKLLQQKAEQRGLKIGEFLERLARDTLEG